MTTTKTAMGAIDDKFLTLDDDADNPSKFVIGTSKRGAIISVERTGVWGWKLKISSGNLPQRFSGSYTNYDMAMDDGRIYLKMIEDELSPYQKLKKKEKEMAINGTGSSD